MPDSTKASGGHRDRLRTQFDRDAASLKDLELLELLLTYAIPRRDTRPMAEALLERFGTLADVTCAGRQALEETTGIGKQASRFLHLVGYVLSDGKSQSKVTRKSKSVDAQRQFHLLDESEPGANGDIVTERPIRAFVHDESANSLLLLPEAPNFHSLEEFRGYLSDNLPYNSAATRRRRANHILSRFYPDEQIDTALTYFVSQHPDKGSLQEVLFYEMLRSEPLAVQAAEELFWPALAFGLVDRDEIREFVAQRLPNLSKSTVAESQLALVKMYDCFGIGHREGRKLRFRLRSGTLDGFVYVLASEFPEPGMYPFKALDQGPMHKWLLWDRQWIRRQIYNLRDLNLISKVSEIDAFRQFSLPEGGAAILRRYFADERRGQLALRENGDQN